MRKDGTKGNPRVVSLAFVDAHDVLDETESMMERLSAARETLEAANFRIKALEEQLGFWERDLGPRIERLRKFDSRPSVLAQLGER